MPEAAFFFDTVTLANFALIESLDLLVARYGASLAVTNEVLDEVIEGVSAGYSTLHNVVKLVEEGSFSSVAMGRDERALFAELIAHLGPGEASCVAAAACRSGTVVTDDRAARNHCVERNLPVTGTIGILKAMCRDGELAVSDADRLLSLMIDHGFYSPVSRIRDVM